MIPCLSLILVILIFKVSIETIVFGWHFKQLEFPISITLNCCNDFCLQLPPAIRLVQTSADCYILLPFKVKPSVQPQNKDLASKKAVKPDTEISSLISQLVNSRCPCIAVTDHTVRLIILFLTLQVLQQRAVKSPCGLITPRNENATTWWQ